MKFAFGYFWHVSSFAFETHCNLHVFAVEDAHLRGLTLQHRARGVEGADTEGRRAR